MPDIDPLSPIRAIVSRSSKNGKPLGSESSLPGPKKTCWNSAAVMGPRTDRQKERFFFTGKDLNLNLSDINSRTQGKQISYETR